MTNRQRHSTAERVQWVAKWRASGLSGIKFAARHGLNESTLYRWAQVMASPMPASRAAASHEAGAGFTQVRVRGAGTLETGVIEIALPGGRIVRVRGEVDAAQLRLVLEAAGAC